MQTALPFPPEAPAQSTLTARTADLPTELKTASDQAADRGELSWDQLVPRWRRPIARLGLQGKLIVCFMYMLALALGTSCWVFARQSSDRVTDIMGEQTRQLSYTVTLAATPAFEADQGVELQRIGHELLKARNMLFAEFLSPTGTSLACVSRETDFEWRHVDEVRATSELMQIHREHSAQVGDYLTVLAPVLGSAPSTHLGARPGDTRLLGYVLIGVSQAREQAQLRKIHLVIIGIACLMLALSLPMAFLLVHRIFLPIRQLVTATHRISSGDLNTRVAIHRPDIIGTLARAFNEMVRRVESQQDALEAANSQLEGKVRERTGQLETANRRLSMEIAEKEDFLRAVSHDLNAPLRNISGMAAMLLTKHGQTLDADIVHRLQRIQKNVEAETDLIAELLELSRIKTRRMKIETVDVHRLIADLGEMFENDFKSRAIELIVDGPLPVLNCEKARIRQVFQNLIDNAIKYMGDGELREIHIGCTVSAGEAEFYVRDTGIGIEAEDLGKVFFVFRRGKSQAVQNVSGKGVGLASVKSIVETYSGSIRVESQVGQGSTFKFTLNGEYVAREGGGRREEGGGRSQPVPRLRPQNRPEEDASTPSLEPAPVAA